MKIITLFLAISLIGCQAKGQLKIGDKVPEFSLQDQNGNTFNSSSVIGQEVTVMYFYPKDDTPGCTKEACSFRDNFEAFTSAGVRVIGISSDDVESHKKFEEKYNLPFTLLADVDNEVRNLFGVKGNVFGMIPGRVTFVISKEGNIVSVFESQVNAEKHIKESLEAIKKLN
jgi:peroxiredoxin Q/BCP